MHIDLLVRKVSVRSEVFYIESEALDNYKYAFYLVHNNGVEKTFYSTDSFRQFKIKAIPGTYKIICFYKDPNGKVENTSIRFTYTSENVVKPIQNGFFVYGGCVSRDIFNSDYNKNSDFKVVNYYARYSIAKLTSMKYLIEPALEGLSSPFQKRMVIQDLKNDLFEALINTKFDCFLVDFLTIRLNLLKNNEYIFTCSNEFVNSGIMVELEGFEVITPLDNEYWSLWEQGFQDLIKFLIKNKILNKLVIQKLYWAEVDSLGQKLPNIDKIKLQNKALEKAYLIAEKYVSKNFFINYSKQLFVANSEHRWGLSPIHYIDDFYITAFSGLKKKIDLLERRLGE